MVRMVRSLADRTFQLCFRHADARLRRRLDPVDGRAATAEQDASIPGADRHGADVSGSLGRARLQDVDLEEHERAVDAVLGP